MIPLEKIIEKHIEIFGKDLGPELAESFVKGLYDSIRKSNNSLTPQNLMNAGTEIFGNLAKETYGPLMCSFVDWILSSYGKTGKDGKIFFLARDAVPMFNIAKTLVQSKDYGNLSGDNLELVYFTRKLSGESDEIAGFGSRDVNGTMIQYLEDQGLNKESLLVDMGMYGSLYNKGSGLFWKEKENPSMTFFYSKNPNILGFLNLICGDYDGKMSQDQKDLANILVDSGECVNPQKYWSPGEFLVSLEGITPKLEPIEDIYIQRWHEASISGYLSAAAAYLLNEKTNVLKELDKLKGLVDRARNGEWTGVLPHITPEWSLKNDFLNNTAEYRQKKGKAGWKCGLAPPFGTAEISCYLDGYSNRVLQEA